MPDFETRATEFQGKLEFFILTLIFAILALSVQTANFGDYLFGDLIEILGWILLLISGIAGIFRLQYVPIVLRYYAAKEKNIEIDEAGLLNAENKLASRIYLWIFVSGLILILIGRSYFPLSELF